MNSTSLTPSTVVPSWLFFLLASLFLTLSSCVTTKGPGGGGGAGEFTVNQIQADLFDTQYVAAPGTPPETVRLEASARLVELCSNEGYSHFILLEKTETSDPAPSVTVAVRLFKVDPKLQGTKVFDAAALKANPVSIL